MKATNLGTPEGPSQSAGPSEERQGSRSLRVFISYRRDDTAADAGRLYDSLSAHFGRHAVFMDIDAIPPGVDFAAYIHQTLSTCDVLIAVIGRDWLTAVDQSGNRRLDDENDFVRLEIQSALERAIRVVPVLVQGAQMPRIDQLPESLAALARRHASEISYGRWQYDVERLVGALEQSDAPTWVSPHNIPRQLTSFVGRRSELDAVKRRLATARLVTLAGAGGIGKTRLAIQAATELLNDFRDGAWLVELASVTSAELVPQAIAGALSVRERPGRPLIETLADYLRTRQLLLVLDNCEHLIDAVARFVEILLQACAELRVLVTSREALGIGGEEVQRVPSLSVPDQSAQMAADAADKYEALVLFRDRAATALGSFDLTEATTPLAAQICQRLDGIPLAIELAAARLNVLTLDQVLGRLGDRFRLLTGGSRTALPRQQTLRATIEWSYQLLSEPERCLLRRLAVFASGSSLEGAEDVCAGEPVDTGAVLDLLRELERKSLVLVDHTGAETRFGLLETIRQYGEAQLLESGESEAVRNRHRDWFLSLAERAGRELRGPEQLRWSDVLEVELGNLRVAFEWSIEKAEIETAIRFATAIGWFWFVRGHLAEGEDWLERALAKSAGSSASMRATALAWLAFLAKFRGDFDHAERLAQESLDLYRAASDDRAGFSLRILGMVAEGQDEFEKAIALYHESLAVFRQAGDRSGIAMALYMLGYIQVHVGDYSAAFDATGEALALFRELGDKRHIALSLQNLGLVALHRNEYSTATQQLEESLAFLQESKDVASAAVMRYLGIVARCQGNFALAAAQLKKSCDSFRALGMQQMLGYGLCDLATVARLNGEMERAASLLQESLAISAATREQWGLCQCFEEAADLASRQGDIKGGVTLFAVAAAIREKIGAALDDIALHDRDAVLTAAHSALGESVFSDAWREGQSKSVDEAIASTLESLAAKVSTEGPRPAREAGHPLPPPAGAG